MGEMVYCEFLKLKRTKIKTIVFLGILVPPVLAMFSSIRIYSLNPENKISLFTLYDSAYMFLMLLFGPLVFSVIAAYLFSEEYVNKTLKTILVIPIPKKKFVSGKFLALFIGIMILMLIFWMAILVLCAVCKIFVGADQFNLGTAVFFLIKVVIGGMLLYCAITPIAVIAFQTKGIITPMIVAAIIVLINVIFSNSSLAGFFPWASAYLISTGRMNDTVCPIPVSIAIILLIAAFSYKYCCKSFEKEDVN